MKARKLKAKQRKAAKNEKIWYDYIEPTLYGIFDRRLRSVLKAIYHNRREVEDDNGNP